MKSFLRPGFAVALLSSLIVLIGCKEAPQPAAAATTTKAATSTNAPASSSAAATAPSTTTTASGDEHDDLSAMGIPLYPNVVDSSWTDTEAIRPLVGKPKLDTPRQRNGEMSTKDSFADVYAWYRKRMPGGSESAAAAASSHTTTDGDLTALFESGKDGDPAYQRVMILRGKNDQYTLVNLTGHVAR